MKVASLISATPVILIFLNGVLEAVCPWNEPIILMLDTSGLPRGALRSNYRQNSNNLVSNSLNSIFRWATCPTWTSGCWCASSSSSSCCWSSPSSSTASRGARSRRGRPSRGSWSSSSRASSSASTSSTGSPSSRRDHQRNELRMVQVLGGGGIGSIEPSLPHLF